MGDQASTGTVHHDLEREAGLSFVGTDAVGDITAVAATVASKAAISVSILAKAYEKLNIPAFPTSGEMRNWMISLGLACVVGGGFSDELEIAWLAERSSKAFVELSNSPWNLPTPALPTGALDRWRKLDFALAKSLHGMVKQSNESLTADVVLLFVKQTREYAQSNAIINGRRIMADA